jgi:UDP-N-acetylmuramate--alanine ligase
MTNIDHEHMESYRGFDELQQAFVDFANKVPFYGSVVACAGDRHLAAVLPKVKRHLVTYGLEHEEAQIVGTGVELGAFGARCAVHRRRWEGTASSRSGQPGSLQPLGQLELSVPGRHNLENALAAVAVGGLLGLSLDQVAGALRDFQGAERRFQRHGEVNGVLIVDDYGHHPTEIAAVLAAARASLGRRLLVVFQPHRYSRTQSLFDDFGPSLTQADEIVLTDIYAAGEDPLPGVTGQALAEAVGRGSGRPVRYAPTLDAAVAAVLQMAKPGDAVITLGAGSVGTLPRRILSGLEERR